ncbi:hypothetical protein BLNAU_18559 [Blattamonas nauphoetae]|uniref:Uncharacterized protein n=1 Tax=Blattamonas nauphoetae TaxID=2049346 RepID=A0ABQ9X417_9EUKA|nr:hypothetical protein BLNAU_18559 [Blattamonas nauphoetae]
MLNVKDEALTQFILSPNLSSLISTPETLSEAFSPNVNIEAAQPKSPFDDECTHKRTRRLANLYAQTATGEASVEMVVVWRACSEESSAGREQQQRVQQFVRVNQKVGQTRQNGQPHVHRDPPRAPRTSQCWQMRQLIQRQVHATQVRQMGEGVRNSNIATQAETQRSAGSTQGIGIIGLRSETTNPRDNSQLRDIAGSVGSEAKAWGEDQVEECWETEQLE